MSTIYMITWSTIIIFAVSIGRVRDIRQTFGIATVTVLVLILSQTLTAQLAASVGLDAGLIFSAPDMFLRSGPVGWLALLVMPCGWLGPMIGLNFVLRRFEQLGIN